MYQSSEQHMLLLQENGSEIGFLRGGDNDVQEAGVSSVALLPLLNGLRRHAWQILGVGLRGCAGCVPRMQTYYSVV